MALNNAYNQYKENSVYTASPEELTLMLYNGLIKFLMQALAMCRTVILGMGFIGLSML